MGSSELSDSFAILAAQLAESGDDCLRQARLRLGPDDIAGHIGICPECGSAGELGGGLELMAMTFADGKPLGSR
jgi:hypothetical protein